MPLNTLTRDKTAREEEDESEAEIHGTLLPDDRAPSVPPPSTGSFDASEDTAPSVPPPSTGSFGGEPIAAEETGIRRHSSGSRRQKGANRKLEVRRRLAAEVEQGVAAAHEEDPDLRNKDTDLRLLNVGSWGGRAARVWGGVAGFLFYMKGLFYSRLLCTVPARCASAGRVVASEDNRRAEDFLSRRCGTSRL